jgi:hypothetical protein
VCSSARRSPKGSQVTFVGDRLDEALDLPEAGSGS